MDPLAAQPIVTTAAEAVRPKDLQAANVTPADSARDDASAKW